MNEFWTTIITSAAIAALISGIVSVITSQLQYYNSLKLNRFNQKLELSVEVFKKLQDALEKIDCYNEGNNSDDLEDNITNAISIMFERSKIKMEELKRIVDQTAFLITKEQVEYFKSECSTLEKVYVSLLASAYSLNGMPIPPEAGIIIIPPDSLQENMRNYIDNTQKLSDEVKNVIISVLRDLCKT